MKALLLFLVLTLLLLAAVYAQQQATVTSETDKLIAQIQKKVAELGQTSTDNASIDKNDILWKQLRELENAISDDNKNVTPVPKIGFQRPTQKTTPRSVKKNSKPKATTSAPKKPAAAKPTKNNSIKNKPIVSKKPTAKPTAGKKPVVSKKPTTNNAKPVAKTPAKSQPSNKAKPKAAAKPTAGKKPAAATKAPTSKKPATAAKKPVASKKPATKPTVKLPATNVKKPVKKATTQAAIKKQQAVKQIFKPLPKPKKQVFVKINVFKTSIKKPSSNIALIMKQQAATTPAKPVAPVKPAQPTKLQLANDKRVEKAKKLQEKRDLNNDSLVEKSANVDNMASKLSADLVQNFDAMEAKLLDGNLLTPKYMSDLSFKLANQTAGKLNMALILERVRPDRADVRTKVRFLLPGGAKFKRNDCSNIHKPCNSFEEVNAAYVRGDIIRILVPLDYNHNEGIEFPDCKQIILSKSVKIEVANNKQLKFVDGCKRASAITGLFLITNAYTKVVFRGLQFSGFQVPFVATNKLGVFDNIRATTRINPKNKNTTVILELENMEFNAFTTHVIALFSHTVLLSVKNTNFYGTKTAIYGMSISAAQYTFKSVSFKEISGTAIFLVARGISYTYIDAAKFESCGYKPNTKIAHAHSRFNSGDGGAIFYDGIDSTTVSVMSITNSNFEQNYANNGAAIYLQHAKIVRFVRSMLNKNTATRNGAIFVNSGSFVSIEHSHVSENINKIGSGAGFYLNAVRALNVRFTDFDANSAYSNAAISGTGVRLVLITRSRFNYNTARYLGGALYFFQSEVFVTSDSTYTFNKAFADAGGAIKLSSVLSANIENCNFLDNFAVQGGAVALSNVARIERTGLSNGIEISKSLFRRNTASLEGGAIYLSKNFLITINRTGFGSNSATKSGGAIFAAGTSSKQTKRDDRFTQATVTADDYGFVITRSYFSNNTASSGGAIDCKSLDVYLYIEKNVLSKNNATIQGGGIATSCQTYLTDTSLLYSRAGRKGGAVAVNIGSTVRVVDVYVDGASSVDGGAVFVESEASFISNDLQVQNSVANHAGGAFKCNEYSRCYLENTRLTLNKAAHGGAIYAEARSKLNLISSKLSSNVARHNSYGMGGALYIGDANVALNITDTSLTGNNATFGGAIAYGSSTVEDLSSVTITFGKMRLDSNLAIVAGGGFFFSKSYQANLWNSLLRRFNKQYQIVGSKVSTPGYGKIFASQPTKFTILQYALHPARAVSIANYTTVQGFNVTMYPGQAISVTGRLFDFFSQIVANHPQLIVRLQAVGSNSIRLEGSSFDVTINKQRATFGFNAVYVYGNIDTKAQLQISADNVPTYTIDVTFAKCPAGFKISRKLDTDNCEVCAPGSYSLLENSATCLPCPAFAECPGGSIVKSQPNYWYQVIDTTVQVNTSVQNGTSTRMALQTLPAQQVNVHFCPNGKCLGNNQCSDNRDPSSPICAVCKPGYSEWNGSCVKCESSNGLFLTFFILYILFTFLFQHISSQSSKSGSSKILFFFGQTLTLIMAGNDMSQWAKALFDFELISKADNDGASTCPFARDSYGKQLTNMLLPTSFFGLLIAMLLIVLLLKFIVDRIRACLNKVDNSSGPTLEETKQARAADRFEVEKEIARQRAEQAKLLEQPSEDEQTEGFADEQEEEDEQDPENTDMNVDDEQEEDANSFVDNMVARRRTKRSSSIKKITRRFSVMATKAQRSLSNTFLSINSYIISFSNFIIITYQQFTKTGLLYFACSQFGQDSRLIHSTDVVCGSTLYYSWMALYIVAVLYGIVFPIILLAFLLIANKMQWLDNPRFKKYFGPFYVSYRRSTFWYECFSLARRLVLLGFYVIASTLLQNSPGVQFVGFAAILAVCFVVQRLARPFAMKIQNVFEQCAIFVLILVALLRGSYTYIVQPVAMDILISVLAISMTVVLVLNVIRHNWLVVWLVSILQHYILQPYVMPHVRKAKAAIASWIAARKVKPQQAAEMNAIVEEQQEALLSANNDAVEPADNAVAAQ